MAQPHPLLVMWQVAGRTGHCWIFPIVDLVAAHKLMVANPKEGLQPHQFVWPFCVVFSSKSLRRGSEASGFCLRANACPSQCLKTQAVSALAPPLPRSFPVGWSQAASSDSQSLAPASTLYWLRQEQLQLKLRLGRESSRVGEVHSSSTTLHFSLSSAKHSASSHFKVNSWLPVKSERAVPLASSGTGAGPGPSWTLCFLVALLKLQSCHLNFNQR